MDKDCNIANSIIRIGNNSYCLKRVVDKTAQDIHHLIGRKYRNQYRVNADENKVKLNRRKHIALNSFFGDKQSPREQLKEVFELVKPVLSEGVKKELYTILYECDDSMFYIPQVQLGYKKKLKQEQKRKKDLNG